MARSTARRLLVVGGSIAGLMAALRFRDLGWEVTVFERTAGPMEGRGAGITILPGLVEGFRAVGVPWTEADIGVGLPARLAIDREGRVVARRDFHQSMTSWSRLYEGLRPRLPEACLRSGVTVEAVEQSPGQVTAVLADGSRVHGDLLVAADGLRSTLRRQHLPDLHPHYAGYVAWRCLADETRLDPALFEPLWRHYAVCVPPGEQGIGYPVPGPGPGHSLVPGERQYNVVWYHPVDAATGLVRLSTDAQGVHHPQGIPPALVSPAVRREMVERAAAVLAPQFAHAVARARMHFFQPIVDVAPPRLVFGRMALVGDAAFVVRPHVAMGVPKGAGDVLELARATEDCDGDLDAALARFEERRLRVGQAMVARARHLGSYMEAQSGDAAARAAAEAARDPETVMMETAAPLDYERLAGLA